MVSYIGDEDGIIATYQDLATDYSLTQPEFWQSTEADMMFIVWGLVAILMIVLNIVEVIRRQKEVVVRASLGESAAMIALKSAVADLISYAALFILAKLLVLDSGTCNAVVGGGNEIFASGDIVTVHYDAIRKIGSGYADSLKIGDMIVVTYQKYCVEKSDSGYSITVEYVDLIDALETK